MNPVKISVYVISGLIVFVLLFGSFGTVNAGHIGVRTRFSAVKGIVQPGFYMKLPLIEHVTEMNVQTQKEEIVAEAASSDLQNVRSTVALNYNLDPQKVGEVYSKIGTDYKTRIVDPAIQEAVKAATAKHTAEELITKRSVVRDEMKALIAARLQNEFISVSEVSIVNFDFSQSFNEAIEAKVTAEQNALAAKNKLEQSKYEAEQRIATARGEAEAIKIQAQAITSQGGADYVKLQWIEAWKQGGAQVPQTILGGAGGNFLLNIGQ